MKLTETLVLFYTVTFKYGLGHLKWCEWVKLNTTVYKLHYLISSFK